MTPQPATPGCDAHPNGVRCGKPALLYAAGWLCEDHPPLPRAVTNRMWRETTDPVRATDEAEA